MKAKRLRRTAAIANEPATASRGFASWLTRHRVALVCSCGETGDLFFIGSSRDGVPVFSRARFSRAMGIAASPQRIYFAARTQIWRLENALQPGAIANDRFDRAYAPRASVVTGDVDAHEIGLETSGRVVFANTAWSCLAAPSAMHAFKPIWKPKFISKLAPEDRCHLNGIGLAGGQAKVVSVCSMSDVVDGWRDRRADGGAVIDIETDKVLADGLSMPHSPRLYRGALWLADSGSGHLLRIDLQSGRREEIVFATGFLRGLTFVGDYAVMTMSLPRRGRLDGLALAENIAKRQATPWCGLLIVDLRHGAIVEWLHFGDRQEHLFDVAVLPMTRAAAGVSPESAELQEVMTIEESDESKASSRREFVKGAADRLEPRSVESDVTRG